MASIRATVSLAASLTMAAVLAGGCGPTSEGDSVAADPHSGRAEAGPAEFPVTVATADGQVTVDSRPRRIVSM
ncbi:MAG: hypothetical protein ACRDQA_19430, partial [Nocardioidaceae bacterium]